MKPTPCAVIATVRNVSTWKQTAPVIATTPRNFGGSPLSPIVLLVLVAGCTGPSLREPLTGTVTLGGKPLQQGRIQFESAEGETPVFSTGAMIQNGGFRIPGEFGLPPGRYVVRINSASAPFVPEGPPGSHPLPLTKELIPATYNTNSQERIEVKEGVENKFEFVIE